MIWLVFAIMTGAAVLCLLAPLAPRNPAPPEGAGAADIAFFEEQLAEIDHETAQGRLDAVDAEGARAEAARRLLRARAAPAVAGEASPRRTLIAALAAVVLVPAIALPLYWRLGHADQPDMPLTARMENAPRSDDLAGAVARIEQHLREHPEDGRGFEVVAPFYARTGRIDDAVHAYGEALRLLGPTPGRHGALGEALMRAEQGVGPRARAQFEAALALDPKYAMARYYLGVAAAQDGDKAKAEDFWTKLLADAPPGAPYVKMVQGQLDALRGAGDRTADSAPTSEAGKAVAAMPEKEREGMIRSMVERLAGRLRDNGGDVEGWLKLVRAYAVLGDRNNAKQALVDARKALAGRVEDAARLDALARELGIEG